MLTLIVTMKFMKTDHDASNKRANVDVRAVSTFRADSSIYAPESKVLKYAALRRKDIFKRNYWLKICHQDLHF